MASNSLRGHGGQRHTPYNLRTNELRLHVKFEPPRFTGLAVHRFQTEVQTKKGPYKYIVRFAMNIVSFLED